MFGPVKWLLLFLYLWYHKKRSKPLFAFDHRSKDFGKSGVTSLREAWILESPRPLLEGNENAIDLIAFHGVNNDGEVLSVQISRRCNRSAEVQVFLRLASGDEYQLPLHPRSTVWNMEVNKINFTAAGLTFELLEPLRRWRIRFNGVLRKGIRTEWDESDTSDCCDVKFNFIWRPMYNYIAFPQDLQPKILAGLLSDDSSRSLFQRPCDMFQEEWYEQFGQMSGTISINGQDENELMFRGLKERRHGISDWSKVNKDVSIMGVADDGNAFHVFTNDIDGGMKKFVYGYVSPSHNMTTHHVDKWLTRLDEFRGQDEFDLRLLAGGNKYLLELTNVGNKFVLFKGPIWNLKVNIGIYRLYLNGHSGYAIVRNSEPHSRGSPVPIQKPIRLLEETRIETCRRCIVTFDDPECKSSALVGGKGASLSLMTSLLRDSANMDIKFSIPNGVCLTKLSFELHLQLNTLINRSISSVEEVAWKRSPGLLNEECNRLVNSFRNNDMSASLKEELWTLLVKKFGDAFEVTKKFAIRSSALEEDGEEMSAAGLNETFLGVQGFQNICSAVVKCWASQFTHRSVEYRRQNGQLINQGIGVIIQEMVAADVAGVMFSRHPLTGSPSYMMLASNYGIGESVVSDAVDPDTILLRRSFTDRLEIGERQIGSKKLKFQMSDGHGMTTVENLLEMSSKCSLSDSLALRLGAIAIFLERCFGSSRDIEWAVIGEDIIILQSRPVTTDSAMTDFEIIHEFDSAALTDREHYTTANVGEVIPGAQSPLTITTGLRLFNSTLGVDFSWKVNSHRYDPTVLDVPPSFHGHLFFDRIQQKSLSRETTKSASTKGMEIGIFGRVLDDDETTKLAAERYNIPPMKTSLTMIGYILSGMLFSKCLINRATKKYRNFVVPVADLNTSFEVYRTIEQRFYNDYPKATYNHICISLGSSMWNVIVLNMIVGADGQYTSEKYTNFANLIGSYNGVESGDVPFALQNLARAIAEEFSPEVFASMPIKDATFWCMHTSSKVSRLFCEFLQRHGHRGLKELEMSSVTWGMEPELLVGILQGLVKSKQVVKQKDSEEAQTLHEVNMHLSTFKRWLFPWVLSKAKQVVCHREQSKSFVVKSLDGYRYAYRHLARLMVQEGFIPDPELIFFFTHEEIGILLKTRSANLIKRAKQRQRLFPYMDSLVFDEMIVGVPKPITKKKEKMIDTGGSIKGYPVCHGEVRGVARVVTFETMETIQAGDILITRATDIGWSPYFPMLSGIVTEIGGLISHGAVVAREFGLPCIVGAQGATQFFNSGDLVFLNANKGFVCKLDNFVEINLDQH